MPDQTEFLEKWYDFHRGFRIVMKEDGSEERVAVLGEDFRDVSPGFLPRTLEELRAGRTADTAAQAIQQSAASEEEHTGGPSLDETLDQMFEAASLEETQPQQPSHSRPEMVGNPPPTQNSRYGEDIVEHVRNQRNVHAQAMVPAGSRSREYQARRVAALRRELHRMRNGIERVISGLRDLGENVPDSAEATGRLTNLGRTLDAIDGVSSREDADRAIDSVNSLANSAGTTQQDRTLANIQRRVDEARQHLDEARRMRDQAASELDVAEAEFRTSQQRLQQLQRESRTTENYLRLFGTREEMQAAGEDYESPIGGMFTRAMERFRAAEEVRREERVLRQVLQDEARAGSEVDTRRLTELEASERDVWGVPRPPTSQPAPRSQTDRDATPEARGELEEYYVMLRRQGGSQQAPLSEGPQHAVTDQSDITDPQHTPTAVLSTPVLQEDNFPRNMLNAITADRERDTTERDFELRPSASIAPEEEWRRDAEHVLIHLSTDTEMRESMELDAQDITILLACLTHNVHLSLANRDKVHTLLTTPRVVWRSGVIAARFLRRRRANVFFTFTDTPCDSSADAFRQSTENIEIMAEAFQMSAEVRRLAPALPAPQQLHMLYRLQAGRRSLDDVAILWGMVDDERTRALAKHLHQQTFTNTAEPIESARQRLLEEQRHQAARQGNHSREELDAQRRAAQSLAVAAGRTAMQTGPRALIERMANRDDSTRAAYQRLLENGFDPLTVEDDADTETEADRLVRYTVYRPLDPPALNHALSETGSEEAEEEEDEAAGLDAKDTGRPEPKNDEDMMVKMECRICYAQVAEVACLPCGHLVMCRWCSEQHSPVMAHDRTRPRRAAGCPVCRKGIRQKVRVFRA